MRQRLGDGVDAQLQRGGEEGLTDATLRRWLVARSWSTDAVLRDLASHATWREQFVPDGAIPEVLTIVLAECARTLKVSSLHVTYNTAQQWQALSVSGYVQRIGILYLGNGDKPKDKVNYYLSRSCFLWSPCVYCLIAGCVQQGDSAPCQVPRFTGAEVTFAPGFKVHFKPRP